jgi:hypothetical protein
MPPGGGASGAAPPARRRPARPFRRFVLYLAAAWGVLLALAAGHAGAAAAVLAAALYTTLPLLAFARGGGSWRRYPSAAFRLFVVRPALYAQLLLPVAAAAALLGLASGAPFGRALAAGRAAALAAAAAAALFFAAGWAGSRRLRVREVEARVPGLPAAFDGLRVAQLSDLHVGPQTSRRFLARVARATAALAPDLVVLTGDLVDDRAEDAPAFARWLAGLEAAVRPPLGTAAVRRQPRHLRRVAGGGGRPPRPHRGAGARQRRRAPPPRRRLARPRRDGRPRRRRVGGGPRRRAGVRPRAGGRAGARARAQPGGVAVRGARGRGGATVTLSGHTHWGQLAFPRRGWSLASPFNRHAMAGYQEGRALLYVHPGTGFWGLPFRLGAFPEVALVTLRRAPDEAGAGLRVGAPRGAGRAAGQ